MMSGFVSILTDGRHEAVTLSDDFSPTLLEGGIPTEVVSGGTEDVVALAMRLALSQMIAERAGVPLECLWLDEPFPGLDAVRAGNALRLLRNLGAAFPQVVAISHMPETRDAVDHVVELEYDHTAGMTRVVGTPEIAEVA
jgi:exonuclease SbcC